MREIAPLIVGEHDFTSFAAVDPERGHEADLSNLRQIFCSRWEREDDEFVYTVRGNGFLHHMVRNLVGTFLLVGKGTLRLPIWRGLCKRVRGRLPEPPRPPAACAW